MMFFFSLEDKQLLLHYLIRKYIYIYLTKLNRRNFYIKMGLKFLEFAICHFQIC